MTLILIRILILVSVLVLVSVLLSVLVLVSVLLLVLVLALVSVSVLVLVMVVSSHDTRMHCHCRRAIAAGYPWHVHSTISDSVIVGSVIAYREGACKQLEI